MNKKTLTILGIALLVVIAGSFWFVKNGNEQKTKSNVIPTKVEKSQNVQNTNTSVIPAEAGIQEEASDILYNPDGTIDTSNWQTYRNEEYGFEVRYPKNWIYNVVDGVSFYDKNCHHNQFKMCPRSINFGSYHLTSDEDTKNIKNFRSQCTNPTLYKLSHIDEDVWLCSFGEYVHREKFIKDNGYNEGFEYHFLADDGDVFEVNLTFIEGDDISVYLAILQSFKFIY